MVGGGEGASGFIYSGPLGMRSAETFVRRQVTGGGGGGTRMWAGRPAPRGRVPRPAGLAWRGRVASKLATRTHGLGPLGKRGGSRVGRVAAGVSRLLPPPRGLAGGSGAGRAQWAGPRGTGTQTAHRCCGRAAALATALPPEGGGWSGSTRAPFPSPQKPQVVYSFYGP